MSRFGTIVVTGGAGFIGSAVVRHLIGSTAATVVNIDKLTYAGNLESLADVSDDARYRFERVDICDFEAICAIFARHRPDAVLHLAAESHVDRSIVHAVSSRSMWSARTRCLRSPAHTGKISNLRRNPGSAFTMFRRTRSMEVCLPMAFLPRKHLIFQFRRIRRAKHHPIIWCAHCTTRSGCRS